MLKPEEVLALSTIVNWHLEIARGHQQQGMHGTFNYKQGENCGGQAGNIYGGLYTEPKCVEFEILTAYTDWMVKAKLLYEKREEQYAGLSLIEFITKTRPHA